MVLRAGTPPLLEHEGTRPTASRYTRHLPRCPTAKQYIASDPSRRAKSRLLRRLPAAIATWNRAGGAVERVEHLERIGNVFRGAAWREVATNTCHDDRDVVLAAPIVRDLNQALARRI